TVIKTYFMGSLLYIIAIILLIGWAIGVFAFSATGLIHVLLVIAIIAILLRIISGRKPID
ncbi:MAG TPA: lmo0937 family membrane protein, partial [Chitinophagaceae bacterium]|nr:lmo0937 family membrane protein [Chitinophagaceae bacterium]